MITTRRVIAAAVAALFLSMQVRAYAINSGGDASAPKSVIEKPAVTSEPSPVGEPAAIYSSSGRGIHLAHKIFGYGTLAFALCAMGTGIAVSLRGGNVPHYLSALHNVSIYGTTGTALTSMITGYVGYWDSVDFRNGLDTRNSHMLLGTVAALGFFCSMFLAYYYKSETGLETRDGFSPHCDAAKVSGIVLSATIIVIQF